MCAWYPAPAPPDAAVSTKESGGGKTADGSPGLCVSGSHEGEANECSGENGDKGMLHAEILRIW